MVDYLKVSFGMLSDRRIDLLMSEHGGLGLSIYIFCLLTMCNSSPLDDHCSIEIDDIFIDCVSRKLKADKIMVRGIVDRLISMNLLKQYQHGTNRYFSVGFLRGTGELMSNDFRRKNGDEDVANFKKKVRVKILDKPLSEYE